MAALAELVWRGRRRGAALLLVTLTGVHALAASLPAEDRTAIQYLDAERVEIETLEPGGSSDDLAELASWIDGAAVIGLGDGSHGTREFYEIKHRIIEAVVRESGVRTIVFEGPWPEFNRINAYIQGGEGNPLEELRSEWWFWNTGEIVRLVEWARGVNEQRAPDDRIEFRGADMALPGSLFDDVVSYLSDTNPRLVPVVTRQLGCFREFWSYAAKSDREHRACRSGLEWTAETMERQAEQAADGDRAWEAARSARMIVQAESLYRRQGRYDYQRRDALMAENIAELRGRRSPTSPVVYWAHNGHVGSAGIPFYRNQRSAGSYLAEIFGERYYSIGSIAGGGSFYVWEQNANEPSVRTIDLPEPVAGSYEKLFVESRCGTCIVPLDGTEARHLLTPRLLSYGMGGPSVQRPVVDIAELFDAVIFIRSTSPTEYLGRRRVR